MKIIFSLTLSCGVYLDRYLKNIGGIGKVTLLRPNFKCCRVPPFPKSYIATLKNMKKINSEISNIEGKSSRIRFMHSWRTNKYFFAISPEHLCGRWNYLFSNLAHNVRYRWKGLWKSLGYRCTVFQLETLFKKYQNLKGNYGSVLLRGATRTCLAYFNVEYV